MDLQQYESEFTKLAKNHNAVTFEQECLYAKQLLNANQYLFGIANQNPQSLKDSILNIASIGISLNPALRQAYLVPRKGKVCLDPSYIGLCHLACESGSIRYVQAMIVHENDEFQFQAVGEKPLHKFNAFKDRGSIVGVYCVAKTSDNDYLTSIMTVDQINAIRDRSEAYKAFLAKKVSCPWVTDWEEMAKKTVIKNASKLWPKTERSYRLDQAISVSNDHDGIDFESEKIEQETMAQIEQVSQVEKIKDRSAMLLQVKNALVEKTKGWDAKAKYKILNDACNVRSMKDLDLKDFDYLDKCLSKIKDYE